MAPATISARRSRIRRSRDQRRELLERFEPSGQSREQFSRERSLSLSSFERWRRQLSETGGRRKEIAGKSLFVELTPQASASSGPWEVELQLAAGVLLRVRRPC